MTFAFLLLAFSIAWGAVYQPLGTRSASRQAKAKRVTVVTLADDAAAIAEEPEMFKVTTATADRTTWAMALRQNNK